MQESFTITMYFFSFATLALIVSLYSTIGQAQNDLFCEIDDLKENECYFYRDLTFSGILFAQPGFLPEFVGDFRVSGFYLVQQNFSLVFDPFSLRDCPSPYDCPIFSAATIEASNPQIEKNSTEYSDGVGTIELDPTSNSFFNLGALSLGCSITNEPVFTIVDGVFRQNIDPIASCEIKITGYRADEKDVLGPIIVKFDPPDPVGNPRELTSTEMFSTQFPTTWSRLKKLTFEVVPTSIRDPATKVVVGSVSYALFSACCTLKQL
jgi:hypothetical protein